MYLIQVLEINDYGTIHLCRDAVFRLYPPNGTIFDPVKFDLDRIQHVINHIDQNDSFVKHNNPVNGHDFTDLDQIFDHN